MPHKPSGPREPKQRIYPISAEAKARIIEHERNMLVGRMDPRQWYEATCVSCGNLRWRLWTERELAMIALQHAKLVCGKCGSRIIEIALLEVSELQKVLSSIPA